MKAANQPDLGSRALSRRLILWTVVFSGALALVITLLQLFIEYQRDVDLVEQRFDMIQNGYLPSIIDNVWVADRDHLGTLLDGIVHLPDFSYAEVRVEGKPFVEGGRPPTADGLARHWTLQREYRGQQLAIGELTIKADLAAARQRVVDRAVFIIAANVAKTMLVAAFMMLLVERIVTRHLGKIAQYLANSSPEQMGTPLALDRPPREDELERLVKTLNHLHADLAAHHARLQESEERYRRLTFHAPIGILHFDSGRHITYANPHFANMLGVAPKSLIGLDLGAGGGQPLIPVIETALAGQTATYEGEYAATTDGNRQISARTAPVTDHAGHIVGGIAIVEDITERRRAEAEVAELNAHLEQRVAERTAELEIANKELDAFSYSISHDLRAPLRAINGFSHILTEEYDSLLDKEGRRYLDSIGSNAIRMSNLIDDLLEFSRMSRREIALVPVDMTALAREVFEEVRGAVPERNVVLRLGNLPPARGDRAMIRQALFNLLSNAVKFSAPRAEAVIEIDGIAGDTESTYRVKDNGTGFDMQYVDKLFGVFQRLHGACEFEGTGIGLAIVKRIVARHGGRVWAEGKVDTGATFHFTLPRAAVSVSSSIS